jgi:hypothetical protein
MEELVFSNELFCTPSGKQVPFHGRVKRGESGAFAVGSATIDGQVISFRVRIPDGGDGSVAIKARATVEEWLRHRY